MTKETIFALMKDLASYYHTSAPDGRAMRRYVEIATPLDDKDADKLFNAITDACDFFPKFPTFETICSKLAPEMKPTENKFPCPYCGDDGFIVGRADETWGGCFGFCPMCVKGKTRKALNDKQGGDIGFVSDKDARMQFEKNKALKEKYGSVENCMKVFRENIDKFTAKSKILTEEAEDDTAEGKESLVKGVGLSFEDFAEWL